MNELCIIRGDFDVTRYIDERRDKLSLREDSVHFNATINRLSLVDFPGRRFTWSNGRLSFNMAKLDRSLASDVSDHVPVFLCNNANLVSSKGF